MYCRGAGPRIDSGVTRAERNILAAVIAQLPASEA